MRISDGEQLDDKMLKTKIRRLYDIANVLQSIGLIRKTQMIECRKPAFKWIGLHGTVKAIHEIKELVEAAREELNTFQKTENKDLHLALTKTLSQRVQNTKMNNDEGQNKYDNSPKKLKRSNSFVECSPAQGSLEFAKNSHVANLKNGRKLNFDMQDSTNSKQKSQAEKIKDTCQQSEGDIIELTQSAKKRRQAMISLINEGAIRPTLELESQITESVN